MDFSLWADLHSLHLLYSLSHRDLGGRVVEQAFVVMQVGAKDSLERKRADEIYGHVVGPAVTAAGLEPYRADLDPSPGGITPKMLLKLLGARVVIADLTGSSPNVFYELGIAHSFARPLILIASSPENLPFDAKDERVIELGEYTPAGLTYTQGERAQASLRESLGIVLADSYSPPSPLHGVAANRSVAASFFTELLPEETIRNIEHDARTNERDHIRIACAHTVWSCRPDRARPLLEDARHDLAPAVREHSKAILDKFYS
jgi:hypothetical protein